MNGGATVNKHQIDLTLLRKMFGAGNMTDPDIAEIMGESNTTIRQYRVKMGFERPERIKCNICKEMKKPNCYNHKRQGVCIKCRNNTGIKPINGHGGRPCGELKRTARAKCLKCNRPFLTRLGYNKEKINRICPTCARTNSYLGSPEEQLPIRI